MMAGVMDNAVAVQLNWFGKETVVKWAFDSICVAKIVHSKKIFYMLICYAYFN